MVNFPRSLFRFVLVVVCTTAFAGLWAIMNAEDKVFSLAVLVVTFAAIGVAMFSNLERIAFISLAALIPIRVSVNLAAPAEYARAKLASGFVLSLTDCLILVLLAAWGRRILLFDQPIKLYPRISVLVAPLIIFVIIGGTRTGNDHASGADMVFHFLLCVSLFYYLLNNRQPLKTYFFHSAAVCLMLIFEGMLGIIQQTTGSNAGMEILGAPTSKMADNTDSRMMGTVPSSNMLGSIVSLMIVHPVAMFFCSVRKYKILLLGVLLMVCLTILGTKSRGVWLSSTLVFSYGLFQMFRVRFSVLRSTVGVGWLLTFIILVALAIPGITDRIFREDHGSAESRLFMNQIAVNMISAKPMFGFGWNNYTLHFHDYDDTLVQHSYDFPFIVHNGYLLVGAEYGLPALLLLLWIWLRILKSTLRKKPKGVEFQQLLAFFFPWIFLGRMLQTPLYINNPIVSTEIWYTLAMCILFAEWCQEDEEVRAEGGVPESLEYQI